MDKLAEDEAYPDITERKDCLQNNFPEGTIKEQCTKLTGNAVTLDPPKFGEEGYEFEVDISDDED